MKLLSLENVACLGLEESCNFQAAPPALFFKAGHQVPASCPRVVTDVKAEVQTPEAKGKQAEFVAHSFWEQLLSGICKEPSLSTFFFRCFVVVFNLITLLHHMSHWEGLDLDLTTLFFERVPCESCQSESCRNQSRERAAQLSVRAAVSGSTVCCVLELAQSLSKEPLSD